MTAISAHPQRNTIRLQLRQNPILRDMPARTWEDFEPLLAIADYRKEQGLGEYDELARGWRQLVLKKQSSCPSIGKPTLRSRQLYFMACYDIDRFREFVFAESFAKLFELTAE